MIMNRPRFVLTLAAGLTFLYLVSDAIWEAGGISDWLAHIRSLASMYGLIFSIAYSLGSPTFWGPLFAFGMSFVSRMENRVWRTMAWILLLIPLIELAILLVLIPV